MTDIGECVECEMRMLVDLDAIKLIDGRAGFVCPHCGYGYIVKKVDPKPIKQRKKATR